MSVRSANPAQRRYNRRVLIISLTYMVLLFAEQYLLRRGSFSTPLRFALAILPALPIVGMFIALGRYLVEESDEYLRARTARQLIVGTGIALSALTLWGFPEDAGLLPHLPLYFAAVFWFAGFGLAGIVLRLFDR